MNEMDRQNGEDFCCQVYEHFTGTTVPRKSLFDHLAAGGTLDSFLTLFPSVSRERAEAILVEAQLKQDQCTKAGKPATDLYAAYLEAVNQPTDDTFHQEADELASAFKQGEAFREIAKKKGFLLDDEIFEFLERGQQAQHE